MGLKHAVKKKLYTKFLGNDQEVEFQEIKIGIFDFSWDQKFL
jgi:hypothetical protein